MKKLTLALGIVSLALTVSASPRTEGHERSQWLGRHGYDHDVVPYASVPEATSTMALAIMGIAALGAAGAISKKRKQT